MRGPRYEGNRSQRNRLEPRTSDLGPDVVNITQPFVKRPVATTLLTIGVSLAGIVSFGLLPVSPLPQVDFPVVSVTASLPGASPEVMAATVATPLERALGRIAGVNEMTSSSSLGNARVTLQFELNRDINGAAREVQAAIQAARSQLPTSLPNNPTYRKANPADAPIMILAMTSDRFSRGQMYDMASTILAQRISQLLTIFTTPVIYLYFDRAARRMKERGARSAVRGQPQPEESPRTSDLGPRT